MDENTKKLIELAKQQANAARLKQIRDAADRAYKAAQALADATEAGLRLHFMGVYQETGETGHPAVTVYEYPILVYDPAAVLGAALKHAPEYAKIAVTLAQSAFERDWKADPEQFPWATVEQSAEMRVRFTGLAAMLTAAQGTENPDASI